MTYLKKILINKTTLEKICILLKEYLIALTKFLFEYEEIRYMKSLPSIAKKEYAISF